VIQQIDNAALTRIDHVLSYSVIEHYSLFRNGDESIPHRDDRQNSLPQGRRQELHHPLPNRLVLMQKFVLAPLLENEKTINQPGNVEKSWFTSSNYEMNLKAGVMQQMNGHDCLGVEIAPKRKPQHAQWNLWSMQKMAPSSRSTASHPAVLHVLRPAKMMRQYATVSGFAMATHARAESDSSLFGRTILTIEYTDYQVQLSPRIRPAIPSRHRDRPPSVPFKSCALSRKLCCSAQSAVTPPRSYIHHRVSTAPFRRMDDFVHSRDVVTKESQPGKVQQT